MAVSKAADHSSSVRVPPHLVGDQAEVAQYRPEWLTRIDRVEEPLPHRCTTGPGSAASDCRQSINDFRACRRRSNTLEPPGYGGIAVMRSQSFTVPSAFTVFASWRPSPTIFAGLRL
jgi:hypothetical protein